MSTPNNFPPFNEWHVRRSKVFKARPTGDLLLHFGLSSQSMGFHVGALVFVLYKVDSV